MDAAGLGTPARGLLHWGSDRLAMDPGAPAFEPIASRYDRGADGAGGCGKVASVARPKPVIG